MGHLLSYTAFKPLKRLESLDKFKILLHDHSLVYVKFRKPSDTVAYNSFKRKQLMYSHSCNKFDTATIKTSGNFILEKIGKSDDILNSGMYNVRIN